MKIKYIVLSVVFFYYAQQTYAYNDISRGHKSGELYFSSVWYWLSNEESYNVICYSDDNGQTLTFKYICNVFVGNDMLPGNILNGASDSIFYNYIHSPLPAIYISYNHCITWEQCTGFNVPSNFYSAGNEVGVVYTRSGQNPGLYKSYDFANTFEQVKEDSVYGFLEVGTEPAEIYFSWGPSQYHDFEIYYSYDGGQSFTFINTYDSTIAGYNLMGNYPRIYRGTEPGEIYLVSWYPPENFKIFYSTDYGASFISRYQSPQCNLYFEGYAFTPGYDQGTFYYIKNIPWFDGTNTKVHIFHSSDTAKTFTEYIHVLDSTFPVAISKPIMRQNDLVKILNYPNPFNNMVNISFQMNVSAYCSIEIFNLSGQAVLRKEEFFDRGQQTIKLQTRHLTPGVYLCSIKYQNKVLGVSKIVKGK